MLTTFCLVQVLPISHGPVHCQLWMHSSVGRALDSRPECRQFRLYFFNFPWLLCVRPWCVSNQLGGHRGPHEQMPNIRPTKSTKKFKNSCYRIPCVNSNSQVLPGAEEACWAHNPKVLGSKPRWATATAVQLLENTGGDGVLNNWYLSCANILHMRHVWEYVVMCLLK